MVDGRKITKKMSNRLSVPLGWILILFGGLIVLISLAMILRPPADGSVQPARIGRKLSNFTLPDLSGNPVRLDNYAGMNVLINTWATWCPPCRAEMPELVEYYTNHRHQNFVILAINAGESAEKAGAFADEMGMGFPVLLDTDYRVLDGLGINNYPTSILVGPDGVIKKIKIGMFLPGELEKEITPLLVN